MPFIIFIKSESEENDKLLWKPKKNGVFLVKSYDEILLGMDERDTTSSPTKQIWEIQAPPKIAFFTWEASRNGILMIDMLRKRGQVLVNCCYMCKIQAETCNHLLLFCLTVQHIWIMIYGLLGVC